MSDVWLRLAIVAGAGLVSLGLVVMLRRSRSGPGSVGARGLSPGVYLFSSSSCVDCLTARGRLEQTLGPAGFVELLWEDEPELFAELGIDVVPYTVVVADDGSAARYPGAPEKALEKFNP
jgi:hypothetical protein